MIEHNFKHLPLKNAYNVRDLGGYPCSKGKKITNYHAFLRADDLYYLNNEEIDYLIGYGLTAVIDLRSKEETDKYPDPFEKSKYINYVNIPLITENISDITRINTFEPKKMMTQFYMVLLKSSVEAIKNIFEFIASSQEGAVLFHCTAGKDRTGVTAMLLLMLSGACDTDIIADYAVTYIYNSANPILAKIMLEYPEELLRSDAEYIIPVIEFIKENYKSVDQYLEHIGVSKDDLDKVTVKICG